MVGIVGYLSQAISVSVVSTKRLEIWSCPEGSQHLSGWAFHRLLYSNRPTGNLTSLDSTSGFVKGARNTQCPSNSKRQTFFG